MRVFYRIRSYCISYICVGVLQNIHALYPVRTPHDPFRIVLIVILFCVYVRGEKHTPTPGQNRIKPDGRRLNAEFKKEHKHIIDQIENIWLDRS